MPWGAKGSFAGWVRGWAMSASPALQTHSRLCGECPGCALITLQTLAAQQLSLLLYYFFPQNARHPSNPELRAGTQERFIPGDGGCRSLQLSLFSSSSSSSLPAQTPASNQPVLHVHAGFGSNFEGTFQASEQCCGVEMCPGWGGRPRKRQTREPNKGVLSWQKELVGCPWLKPCLEYLLT